MSSAADVAAVIRNHSRLVVACHENPDGDALGSLLGLARAMARGGYDVVGWAPGNAALPADYHWLGLDGLVRAAPDDLDKRLLIAVDCGSADRLGAAGAAAVREARETVNVDHHGDNTRFGAVAWVEPDAPCAAVMVRQLLVALDLEIDPDVATALYVGLVTDTGDFRYQNAGVEAHREAIALIEHGADPAGIARAMHGARPLGRVRLLGRALDRLEIRAAGRFAVTWVTAADFEELGALEEDSEGIVNHLRSIDGVDVAVLLREPSDPSRGRWKGSLRAGRPEVDVAAIAHAFGGGGHRQAAGFSSDGSLDEVLEGLEQAVDALAD